ncbi:MAG: HAD family hydrolase [Magnetospiraceae bacterium]
MTPALVIFDCDGVLVDSEAIASWVLAQTLTEAGFNISPAECVDRFTGLSLDSVAQAVHKRWRRPLPEDFLDRLRARDRAAFAARLTAIDGAADAVMALPCPVCVASSGSMEKITHSLTLTGLIDLFTPHLFSASLVAAGKPAPDLFLYAAAQFRVDPADCVVVEDSLNGVKAGVAAGMTVLGFHGGAHFAGRAPDVLRQAGARLVFKEMADLPRLIETLDPEALIP